MADMRLAQDVLWGATMGDARGFHEVSLRFDGEWGSSWIPATDRRWLMGAMENDDVHYTLVPRLEAGDVLVGPASVLWAKLSSGRHCDALTRFKPTPTLVIREGMSVRRTAVWALSEPVVDHFEVEAANKRIAHRLGTKKSDGEVQRRIHPPGAVMRVGRETRPLRCWPEFVNVDGLYTVGEVTGRLEDPPAPRAWWEDRAAA